MTSRQAKRGELAPTAAPTARLRRSDGNDREPLALGGCQLDSAVSGPKVLERGRPRSASECAEAGRSAGHSQILRGVRISPRHDQSIRLNVH